MGANVHYDNCFYRSDKLKEWAVAYLAALPKSVTLLISAGASGCAIASAMLALSPEGKLRHRHIHPEKRVSHRGQTKASSGVWVDTTDIVAFVDDFVDTGATAINAIRAYKKNRSECGYDSEIKAIVLGNNCEDTATQKVSDALGVRIFFANKDRTVFPKKLKRAEKNLLLKEFTPR